MDFRNTVHVNHLGYLCDTGKEVIIEDCSAPEFELQDMSLNAAESLDRFENWESVFRGDLQPVTTDMGRYLKGDFSSVRKPGLYRVVVPGTELRSYQFMISNGTFSLLPRLFLDFIHIRRSGAYEDQLRGPCHLDDAIRSDNGQQIDVSGGWYDAGDLRKWMSMTLLPALGFLNIKERLGWKWNHFALENVSDDDLVTETIWAIHFLLKMQNPSSGMIYEEVGAGGEARRNEGMHWWYENHSGCYADNSQNHFTDNIPNSGDERIVRVQYNPIVQYTSIVILLRAAGHIRIYDRQLADRCVIAAQKCWNYVRNEAKNDPFHGWTSVRSWAVLAAIEIARQDNSKLTAVDLLLNELLELWNPATSFWFMDNRRIDSYRGLIHSAQPVIALAKYLETFEDGKLANVCLSRIRDCLDGYLQPLSHTNPFNIIPYGLFFRPPTEGDLYRDWKNGVKFRFFMPDHSIQKVNHGLAGHWTSWAHALSLCGKLLDDRTLENLAWAQIYWLIGNNPLDSSLISGIGYRNPMPHSRFFGTLPGGFCAGPRGTEDDEAHIDLLGRAEWSSTEYWNVPVANSLNALSLLIPAESSPELKLGYVARH